MISTKEVKSKMNTTKNIVDITSALEVVSIIRMKRAQEVVRHSKNFIKAGFEILKSLLDNAPKEYFAENKKKNDRTVVIVVTSDKGLCGPFNINVIKKLNDFLNSNNFSSKDVDLITIGRWGYNLLKRDFNIIKSFQKFSDVISVNEVSSVSDEIFKIYSGGEISKIYIIYTDFISSIKNSARAKQVLPYDAQNVVDIIKEIFPDIEYETPYSNDKIKKEYIFEPDAKTIIEKLTPFLFKIQMFYFITESNAAEHSLRMIAMRNAKDTASDFLKKLTLVFNKARQEKITSELIEITSAKELL